MSMSPILIMKMKISHINSRNLIQGNKGTTVSAAELISKQLSNPEIFKIMIIVASITI